MLDDDERIAGVAQFHEHFEELVDVGEVQARGRFIEDVNGAPGGLFRQLGGELDALRFAPAERRAVLPEPHVAEPHVFHRDELVGDLRHIAEETRGFIHGHVQHVGDILSLVSDLECLPVVAAAAADLTLDIDVGEEVHLDLFHAVAFARFAASAFHIEAEASDIVAANARGGQAGKEFAHRPEGAGVGHGIGARGAADGRLVDDDRLVDLLEAEDALVFSRTIFRAVKVAEERAPQDVVHERGFATAGDAGHAGEAAEWKGGGEIAEVILRGAEDRDPTRSHPTFVRGLLSSSILWRHILRLPAQLRDGNLGAVREVLAGGGMLDRFDLRGRALRHEMSATRASAGAEVEHMICGADGVFVVLDDDHGISQIAQAAQRANEPVVVALVQADARFIQHVETAREA